MRGLPVGCSWGSELPFSAFGRQSGPHPAPLALRVVPHVRVPHDRQLPGGLFGGRSQGAHAVDDYVGVFVGQDLGCQLPEPIEWQVDGARQMGILVVLWVQNLHENHVTPAFDLRLKFFSSDGSRQSAPPRKPCCCSSPVSSCCGYPSALHSCSLAHSSKVCQPTSGCSWRSVAMSAL